MRIRLVENGAMRASLLPGVIAAALAAGCAQQENTRPVEGGTAEPALVQSNWKRVKNADGRDLLEHLRIEKCFVDPQPPQDFNHPGFTVKREQKTVGAATYDVANVYEGRDFWMSVYRAAGSPTALLGVYSEGRCREAAEQMLLIVQKRKGPA